MKTRTRWIKLLQVASLISGFLALAFHPALAQSGSPLILVLKADGVVAPAMEEYILRGIQTAEQRNADLLVIELNTPGGYIETMTDIVEGMRASRVPIVVYVSPRGAMAGSAGTIITLAGHVAAMAPETIIGAASPIDSSGADLGETAKAKEMEALTAMVRSIASRRSPEAIELAQKTITDAKAVSVDEALAVGLIDFTARDLDHLLEQVNGFEVQLPDGAVTLNLDSARVEQLGMSFIEQLLDILVNPNIVFLLSTIGVQALLIELSSPGGWVAGFIGVICLALAAYGYGVLPVNWFGMVFLVTAFVLFVLDIKAPTHGALTVAGVGSFIAGSLLLFNSSGSPEFQQVSTPLVIGTGVVLGISFGIIVGIGLRAQRGLVRVGQESFAGREGMAKSEIAPRGQVQVMSELWSAELAAGAAPIQKGQRVKVVAVSGLRLVVIGIEPPSSDEA